MLLPCAFWAHDASKMALWAHLCYSVFCNVSELRRDILPPGACCTSRAYARRIVSCRGVCVSSLCPQIPHAPGPTFGVFFPKQLILQPLFLHEQRTTSGSRAANSPEFICACKVFFFGGGGLFFLWGATSLNKLGVRGLLAS